MHAGSRPWPTRSEHSVHLKTFLVSSLNFGMLNGHPDTQVLAADAVLLLEVDDAVRVLHDRAVGRTGAQAAGVRAVHALVLAHEPHRQPRLAVLGEPDQVPVVPLRGRHRLVGVVEGGHLERQVVPFQARHLARLAADAGGDVDVLGNRLLALHAAARDRARVSRDGLDLKRAGRHVFIPPFRPSRASRGSP